MTDNTLSPTTSRFSRDDATDGDLRSPEDLFKNDGDDDDDNDIDEDRLLITDFDDEEENVLWKSVEVPSLLTDAPRKAATKRRHTDTDMDQLSLARKRLFADVLERPTMSRFCVEGETVDMEDSASCSDQRKFFARIFNALEQFSQCRFDEKDPLHRNLALEAQLTVLRLKKLKVNGYKEFYMSIPSAVLYVLRAMSDIQYIRPNDMIIQLVPVTCTIDKTVRERLQVNGLELREVNTSISLSVRLSMDVKLLYGGQVRAKTLLAQGDKHYVFPAACMGDYMNTAVHDLYDLIYDRTKEYIRSFYRMYPEDSAVASGATAAAAAATMSCNDVFTDMDTRNMYSGGGNTIKSKELKDRQVLSYLLRAVGRDINLKKVDLDRNTIFVLTSSVNKKQKYLRAGANLTCSVTPTPVVDAEAVFLSSFVRARIMEDGSLHFQIYSRTGMYISDNSEFPEWSSSTT